MGFVFISLPLLFSGSVHLRKGLQKWKESTSQHGKFLLLFFFLQLPGDGTHTPPSPSNNNIYFIHPSRELKLSYKNQVHKQCRWFSDGVFGAVVLAVEVGALFKILKLCLATESSVQLTTSDCLTTFLTTQHLKLCLTLVLVCDYDLFF